MSLALSLLAAGCQPRSGPADVKSLQAVDPDVFRTLPLPVVAAWNDPVPAEAPRRIVSMIPSVTELLFTIGLGDRVIGRDDWSDWPVAAETRPSLGNQQTSSVERIADLRPDLVVFWKHLPDKSRQLSELFRLNVVTPGTESRAEVFDGIVEVARACGVQKRGTDLVAWLGPCVHPECYEFGADDLAGLEQRYGRAVRTRTASGAVALDLPMAVGAALGGSGVALVGAADACTACDASRFFSHRARGDEGRHALAVWIEP